MAIRNTTPSSTFEEWRQETNEIATDAGDVSNLSTTASNLTDAINEHEGEINTNSSAIAQASGDSVAMAIALGG